MRFDQRSIWENTSTGATTQQSDEYEEHERYKQDKASHCSQCFTSSCKTATTGLILGMLVSGTALGILLTLYLSHESKTLFLKVSNAIIKAESIHACPTITVTTTTSTSSTTTTTTTITTTVTTTTTTATLLSALNKNLVQNGDGETGTCGTDQTISSPTYWNFSGPVSQVAYGAGTTSADLTSSSGGPSNRGNCYFFGRISATTCMWQTVDLNGRVNFAAVDAQSIRYNLSAWIGGYYNQEDSAIVTVTFFNSDNQIAPSNYTSIGPVSAADRGSVSSLLYEQRSGFVPVGTRSILIFVTFNRGLGNVNNAYIDNIALNLY